MKSYILLGFSLLIGANVLAQDLRSSEVPTTIRTSFDKDFPNARDIEWEKKGANYKVEFEIGRNDHEVLINTSGQILGHKEDISDSQLPQAVKSKIKNEYKAYRIDGADKQAVGSKVLYKVEIESGRFNNKKELDLILDQKGQILDHKVWYELSF